MIVGLSHVLLHVHDLDAAERFYIGFLGFTLRDRGVLRDGRPLIVLRQGLGLTVFPANVGPASKTVDHVAFHVKALQPFIDRLISSGHPYEGPVTTASYGTSIYVADPEGNRIEFHSAAGPSVSDTHD